MSRRRVETTCSILVELRQVADRLRFLASPCVLCPRLCGVRRAEGETGVCGEGWGVRLGGYSLHRGEEPPLSGRDPETGREGSGTVFVTGCSLRCLYCQKSSAKFACASGAISLSMPLPYLLEGVNKPKP